MKIRPVRVTVACIVVSIIAFMSFEKDLRTAITFMIDSFNSEPVPIKICQETYMIPRNYFLRLWQQPDFTKPFASLRAYLPNMTPISLSPFNQKKLVRFFISGACIGKPSSYSVDPILKEGEISYWEYRLRNNRPPLREGFKLPVEIKPHVIKYESLHKAYEDVYIFKSEKGDTQFILKCFATGTPYGVACSSRRITHGLTLLYTFNVKYFDSAAEINQKLVALVESFRVR